MCQVIVRVRQFRSGERVLCTGIKLDCGGFAANQGGRGVAAPLRGSWQPPRRARRSVSNLQALRLRVLVRFLELLFSKIIENLRICEARAFQLKGPVVP